MKIAYLPSAVADIDAMLEHVSKDSPKNAEALFARIIDAIRILERYQMAGRPSHEEGFRELIIRQTPFIAIYTILENRIEVVGVFHTSRDPETKPGSI